MLVFRIFSKGKSFIDINKKNTLFFFFKHIYLKCSFKNICTAESTTQVVLGGRSECCPVWMSLCWSSYMLVFTAEVLGNWEWTQKAL